jgi:hypothetical protein
MTSVLRSLPNAKTGSPFWDKGDAALYSSQYGVLLLVFHTLRVVEKKEGAFGRVERNT